jgi:hypothetical protein
VIEKIVIEGNRIVEIRAVYVFKLWLGHGVTTIRDVGCLNGLAWNKDH